MAALQLYARSPELVASLILSGGQVHPSPVLMHAQAVVMRLLPERLLVESMPGEFRERYPELAERAVADGRRLGKRGLLALLGALARADLRPILATICVPTLVLCGAKDRANLPASRRTATAIHGAELIVVPGAGHVWNLERPDLFNRTVLRFAERVDAATDDATAHADA